MPTIETESAAKANASGPHGARIARWVAGLAMIGLIAAAAWMLFFTSRGQLLVKNPRALGQDVSGFVEEHPITAPVAYVAAYVVLGALALPVWWLQLLSGMAFGLPMGVIYSEIAATISALLAARFSHWLAADWFHRVEDHMQKLKSLDETFGKNGLLVVMAVRLCHVLPFGLSNYAFGLTTMRASDIALGTVMGGLPAITVYVAMGTGGRPLTDWRFVTGLVFINAMLLVPLGVKYLGRRG
jgi:uncharacterized membrane protein YdjX (TVP38/TMEM64 family)